MDQVHRRAKALYLRGWDRIDATLGGLVLAVQYLPRLMSDQAFHPDLPLTLAEMIVFQVVSVSVGLALLEIKTRMFPRKN